MMAMNSELYRENRASIPLAQLRCYEGQWVAFSLDGSHIIAANEDLDALDGLVIAAGADPERVALERIELTDSFLGGAEFS
jgi:hypothetical protein